MRSRPYPAEISRPVLLLLLANALSSSMLPRAQGETGCKILKDDQVDPALVKLQIGIAGSKYKRGEPVHVVLTLQAGARGSYLPDDFGSFLRTCFNGFSVSILTVKGKLAGAPVQGCAYAGPVPRISYVKLAAGETRSWSTDLETAEVSPGHYCVYAEYLAFAARPANDTKLNEQAGLLAKGRVTAPPLPVEIR